MPRHTAGKPLGSQLGRSITDLVADTVVKVRQRMAPMEAQHRIDANNAWMEDAETRLQPLMEAIMQHFPDDGIDHPPWVQQLKDMAAGPTNQTDFIIFILGILGALTGIMGGVGSVVATPYVQRAWEELVTNTGAAASGHGGVSNLIPPGAAAALWGRGKLSGAEAAAESLKQGYSQHHVDLLLKAALGPPAFGSLQALWARGGMSDGDLDRLMDDSLIDPAYRDRVKAAFFSTMPPAEAVMASIKGVITDEEGRRLYKAAGGLPEQWDVIRGGAGSAIGVDQAAHLYTHKLISLEDFQAVIRYSRINPRFEPMSELLRFHYLPAFQIVRALKAGEVTAEDATRWLTEDGYPADQVAALVNAGKKEKTQPHHDLALTTITELYQAHEMTEAEATTMLVKLGYDADEVPFILSVYDARRALQAQTAAVTAIRKAYVAGITDHGKASSELDNLGVGHVARDAYIKAWDIEAATEFKQLTMAQVGAALKAGIMSVDAASGRWRNMGYPVEDIGILIQLYPPPTDGGPA